MLLLLLLLLKKPIGHCDAKLVTRIAQKPEMTTTTAKKRKIVLLGGRGVGAWRCVSYNALVLRRAASVSGGERERARRGAPFSHNGFWCSD